MIGKVGLVLLFISIAVVISSVYADDSGFELKKISDNVYVIRDKTDDVDQVVITSEKGMVVLNSFWSETTAERFKKAISELLGRDDFLYLINTVDRLDMFGGNAAYKDIPIIGHREFLDKYQGKEVEVRAEVQRLIEMWRNKERVSRERLANYDPGSEDALNEQKWASTCNRRAEELEKGYSLVLPTEVYQDRKTLDLGDLTLNLIWFGKAGYDGLTVITIPEDKLANIPGFILHPQHLAPHPSPDYAELDVPRWIEVLEEMLEGDNRVENVLCGNTKELWSADRARTHLNYIRTLWDGISKAEAEGKSLSEVEEMYSLENGGAFVKEMQEYKDYGDRWIRFQHESHIRQFFIQHKNLATQVILGVGTDSLSRALDSVRTLLKNGADLYVDDMSIRSVGYGFMQKGEFDKASELFNLCTEIFPEKPDFFLDYANALLNKGDTANAILNYQKTLDLDPDNGRAKEALESLK